MASYKVVAVNKGRGYGLSNFIGDCVMTCVTCGLWLIWVFVREMRN
jgi:hypothetical protein